MGWDVQKTSKVTRTRLFKTCHSDSGDLWQAEAGFPVNTPNIQSHRPVSPALLFKHSLKLTLFFFFFAMSTARERPFGECYCTLCTAAPQHSKEIGVIDRVTERKATEGRITEEVAPLLSSSLSCSWRVWLRDGPTRLRAVRPNRCYAPELLSKPWKLDYWDPSSMAYITNTCKPLAGHHGLNGNAGQIKVDWPVYTLSRPTDGCWKATWASSTGGAIGRFSSWVLIVFQHLVSCTSWIWLVSECLTMPGCACMHACVCVGVCVLFLAIY